MISATFDWLAHAVPPPANYALGLSLFQLFFIPAGLCFWLAARTTRQDAAAVQNTLRSRVAGLRETSPTRPSFPVTLLNPRNTV